MGTCLELDPAVVLQAEVNGKPEFDVPKHLSLGVSIGYNFTDSTYGWNGFMDGFTGLIISMLKLYVPSIANRVLVYYLHFTDTMEEQSHSFPLAQSLTPVVNFQNVKRTYLGFPYTP